MTNHEINGCHARTMRRFYLRNRLVVGATAVLALGAVYVSQSTVHASERPLTPVVNVNEVYEPVAQHGDLPTTGTGGGPSGPQAFTSANITLLSHISLASFGPQFTAGNDSWGYVSPAGREYALMGLNSAVAFVEITDPVNPVVVGLITHPDSPWGDMKVYQDHAYIVSDENGNGGAGIQVVDMSNIDAGVITLVNSVTTMGLATSHNITIDEASGFAYLSGSNIHNFGLLVFDLSNPANPVLAGTSNGPPVHDVEVVTYTTGPLAGRQIAYSFEGRNGVAIHDVTDKANMFLVSRTTYSGLSFSHQGWLDQARQLLYTNDELDELNGLVPSVTTRVFDVSNINSPTLVGTFTNGVTVIDHNLYTRDGFVYESNYQSGVRIFDARTNPTSPTEVGFFDTFPSSDAVGFGGAWNVYPFFPSGNIIVSDLESGLFVLDPSAAIGNPVDLDGNGVVGASDIAVLLGFWGPCPPPPSACLADLDGDGLVGSSDLAIILGNWGL